MIILDREELANEFKKEYEKLCEKYEMEIDMYDVWDTGDCSLQIFDKKQKLYIIGVFE